MPEKATDLGPLNLGEQATAVSDLRVGRYVLEARFDVVADLATGRKSLRGAVNRRLFRGRNRERLFTCDHDHQTDAEAWACGKAELARMKNPNRD